MQSLQSCVAELYTDLAEAERQLLVHVSKQKPSLTTRGAGGKAREVAITRNTLTEVRRYAKPPIHLHRVVQAMLLLLGHDEASTKVRSHTI